MAFDRSRSVPSPTGASINLYVAEPEGTPRGVVQLNHGITEHAARYSRFARFLAGRGFAVYAHDHRGHGRTTAPDAPRGSFGAGRDAGGKVIADVAAILDLIGEERPELPLIVFGHSMGSLIALNVVQRQSHRIAGAAIWNGNFSAGALGRLALAVLAWERFRLGSDVPSRILPRLTFGAWAKKVGDGRTPFDWLSRDAAEVDAYIADPLCGWLPTVGMWQGVFDFIFAGTDGRNFADVRRDMPLNLVGGTDDPATDGGEAMRRLERQLSRMGFSNLVSTIYPGTRHESLNELNRNLIMEDFARWVEKVASQAS